MSEGEAADQEVAAVDTGVSMDTVARIAGDICVELLKQYENMSDVDEDGQEVKPPLETVAIMAHNLARVCCTGVAEG
jgi:hypothetical protein